MKAYDYRTREYRNARKQAIEDGEKAGALCTCGVSDAYVEAWEEAKKRHKDDTLIAAFQLGWWGAHLTKNKRKPT